MNVHYHVAIPDGVFTFSEDDAPAAFHRLPAPDSTDLQEIASDVAIRTLAGLRRRELLRDEPDERTSTEQRDRSALSACLEGSLGLGELTALPKRNEAESDDATLLYRRSPPGAAAPIEASTCTRESSFLPPIARAAKDSCATAPDRR